MLEPNRTEPVAPDAALPAAIRILDPGTCLDQRYEIRRVLGVGGYAVVYLAFDRELRREVALKVLRADRMTPGALKRLRREAAVARDAASPRLVRIFDIGASDAADLAGQLQQRGRIQDREKAGLLRPLDATARRAGQLHRHCHLPEHRAPVRRHDLCLPRLGVQRWWRVRQDQ
jgi:hypothetical protein